MEGSKKIKVLVIDDSMVFRRVVSTRLREYSGIEVVGTAKDSFEAKDKVIQLKPDVLTLDIEMPGINGIEFLKILMEQHPVPTIVISGADGRCFEAIDAGAVGFVGKPTADTMNQFFDDLSIKIKEASIAKLDKKTKVQSSIIQNKRKLLENNIVRKNDKDIIAIGASMGGVEAVEKLLKQLPLGLPPIVITQHMPPIFTKKYAERLDRGCVLKVKEGEDGEELLSGHAYIAPGALQMGIIKRNGKYILDIKKDQKISGHCPSVDYLFMSVAKQAKNNSIGVILTGMGSDGARGLLSIKNEGGYTIGQDKNSCVVYGMPMVAKKIGAVLKEASLDMMPNIILNQLKRRQLTSKVKG